MMAARLTDAQRKKVIADYAELGNYAATGRMNGISDKTVKSIIESDPQTSRISEQKKEQNTLDMLQYMDNRREQAQGIIDDYLKALADPGKIEKAKLSEIATSLGILVDKFAKNTSSVDSLNKLDEVLKNMGTLADVVTHPVPNRDVTDFE
jgi:hypothetical protein